MSKILCPSEHYIIQPDIYHRYKIGVNITIPDTYKHAALAQSGIVIKKGEDCIYANVGDTVIFERYIVNTADGANKLITIPEEYLTEIEGVGIQQFIRIHESYVMGVIHGS